MHRLYWQVKPQTLHLCVSFGPFRSCPVPQLSEVSFQDNHKPLHV